MTEKTDNIDSKFRFILIAAKRARQLQSGAKPLVPTHSHKPTRIAQEEVRAGAVKWELVPYVKRDEQVAGEVKAKVEK
ncbi:MAG: DNA-directed RNA polymerase subunit omega [Acidobacteria bacterium]|nr:DNA-directed RNA polymerase subunit omega [Acidobacteriota bacterium]